MAKRFDVSPDVPLSQEALAELRQRYAMLTRRAFSRSMPTPWSAANWTGAAGHRGLSSSKCWSRRGRRYEGLADSFCEWPRPRWINPSNSNLPFAKREHAYRTCCPPRLAQEGKQ
jgi:hypothetical protein